MRKPDIFDVRVLLSKWPIRSGINERSFVIYRVFMIGIILLVLIAGGIHIYLNMPQVPSFSTLEATPGGGMTAKRLSDRTFVSAGANVNRMDELNFWTGFSLFRDPWIVSPSSTTDRDGLGPLFHTRSCISCHLGAARGPEPLVGLSKPSALVVRLGPLNETSPMVDPKYGGQLQPRGIKIGHPRLKGPVEGEGKIMLTYVEVEGAFADGTEYTLRRPNYKLRDLSHGSLADGIGLSPRLAPVIYGTGLIDAIADEDLLSQEDPSDVNADGISARYNRVPNVKTGEINIGRFGFKAKHPNLAQQVAAAFRDDIGITNDLYPDESCTASQVNCRIAAEIGTASRVEIPNKLLKLVLDFNYWLAVPLARNLQGQQQLRGREQFFRAGCAGCHTPSYITDSEYPDANLAGQTIYPYSDFALHDMGPDLSDGVSEYEAKANEWRTAPLWGLGMQQEFKRKSTFLHDGRATTVQQAILWHGGEAEQSKQYFLNMEKADRKALITFLNAI